MGLYSTWVPLKFRKIQHCRCIEDARPVHINVYAWVNQRRRSVNVPLVAFNAAARHGERQRRLLWIATAKFHNKNMRIIAYGELYADIGLISFLAALVRVFLMFFIKCLMPVVGYQPAYYGWSELILMNDIIARTLAGNRFGQYYHVIWSYRMNVFFMFVFYFSLTTYYMSVKIVIHNYDVPHRIVSESCE